MAFCFSGSLLRANFSIISMFFCLIQLLFVVNKFFFFSFFLPDADKLTRWSMQSTNWTHERQAWRENVRGCCWNVNVWHTKLESNVKHVTISDKQFLASVANNLRQLRLVMMSTLMKRERILTVMPELYDIYDIFNLLKNTHGHGHGLDPSMDWIGLDWIGSYNCGPCFSFI